VLISLQSSQTDSTFLESSQLTIRADTDPAIVLSMFMLSFIFVTKCGLFEWKRICRGFSIIVTLNIFYCQAITGYTDNGSFVYICIAVGDPVIKRGRLDIFMGHNFKNSC
jgi:hypothetical protein